MRGIYIEIDKNLLLETYEKCGRNLNKTAKKLNTTSITIKRRLIEYGLGYDTKVKYSCDESFFDDLNEKSMYWLGFLATDGNVYKNKYSYSISLRLASKDIDILEKFKKDIKFTGPILSYTIKNKYKQKFLKKPEYYSSGISFTSKKIFEKLAEFNIVPAKTYIYKFPEKLINHPLLNHFIRGCIDGDGWIREHCNNGKTINEVRIGLCGTELFIKQTFNIIKQNLKINSGNIGIKSDRGVTWQFEFTALHDVDKLVDWIYKDATNFLERKYIKTKRIKEFASRYTPFYISKEQLENDYNFYKSINKLSKIYSIDPETVKKFLTIYNIEYYKCRTAIYNCNLFTKENESEEKYYWAGFLAGKSTFVVKGKYLSFSSNKLGVIQNFLNDSHINLHIQAVKYKGITRAYSINLFDRILLSQLELFNINGNKENYYKIPEWLLNDNMLPHFLRGYLDARSGLNIFNKKILLNIKNNKMFLTQLNEIFIKNCNYVLTAKIKDIKNNNCQITYLTKQAKAIINYIYNGATIYLDSKYKIYKMI
jgi:hypothetical protein